MKTTIEIADELYLKAKQKSRESKVTMRQLFEKGLRKVLEEEEEIQEKVDMGFGAVEGDGLNPEYKNATWDEMLEVLYRTNINDRS